MKLKQINSTITPGQFLEGTWAKFQGMYVGEKNNSSCKLNKNILITTNHRVEIKRDGVYKRNYKDHKAGDPKFKKVNIYDPSALTPTLQEAWRYAKEYPTVSYGLTKCRREAIIVDSDQEYESKEHGYSMLKKLGDTIGIREPDYVLYNPASKHIQGGWFCEPFVPYEFKEFNALIKSMASAYREATGFEGDICFNGPACKNPYYEGFDTIVNEGLPLLSKEEIANALAGYSTENWSWSKQVGLHRKAKEVVEVDPSDPIYDSNNLVYNINPSSSSLSSIYSLNRKVHSNSRNYIERKLSREWIWSNMKNNHVPTYEEAREKMNEFAQIASEETNKPVHDSNELDTLTKSVLRWSIKQFNPEYKAKASNGFNLIVKGAKSFLNWAEVQRIKKEEPALSARKIGERLGLSNKYVSTLLSSNENDMIKKAGLFLDKCEEYRSKFDDYGMYEGLFNEVRDMYQNLVYNINPSSSHLLSTSSLNTIVHSSTHRPKTEPQMVPFKLPVRQRIEWISHLKSAA